MIGTALISYLTQALPTTHRITRTGDGGIIKDLTLAAGEKVGCKFLKITPRLLCMDRTADGIIRFHGYDEPEF